MDATQIWRAALDRISKHVSSGAFATWFRDTVGLDLQGDVLVVGVGSPFAQNHLEQRFLETARDAASEIVGHPMRLTFQVRTTPPPGRLQAGVPQATHARDLGTRQRVIRARATVAQRSAPARRPFTETARPGQPSLFVVPDAPGPSHTLDAEPHTRDAARFLPPSTASEAVSAPRQSATSLALLAERSPQSAPATPFMLDDIPDDLLPPTALNPRYTFETFVEGDDNRFALAAALEVVNVPGERYNPLVITGDVGLGKTHLLHAIGHRLSAAGLSVAYVTAERFMNEIVEAIRLHTCANFRRRYRTVDALLVDDVQFVAGKEATELEFLHTFNALYERNKQIVLTCDRPPSTLRTLHTGLRSRFASGLLVDLHMPDRDLRLAILRAKAAAQCISFPDEVFFFLADLPTASVRELEGALTTVAARARMRGRAPTLEDVARQFRAHDAESSSIESAPLPPEQVLGAVAQHYDVTVEALRSNSRERHLAWVRHVAMYILREVTPASHQQIAHLLHRSDHTTVMNGCQRVEQVLRKDEHIQQEIKTLCTRLRRPTSGR